MSATEGVPMRDMSWDEAASRPGVRNEPVGIEAIYAEHVRRMDRIAARIERALRAVETTVRRVGP